MSTARAGITRAFSEIAHTLESSEDSEARILRTLEILRELVPYTQAALLAGATRGAETLYAVPPLSEELRARTATSLGGMLRATANESEEVPKLSDRQPHLTLPLVGLDRVIGLLRVQHSAGYETDHVGLLSIVCAQLGAYLTGLHLKDDQARRMNDLQLAHDFQRMLVGIVGHDLRNPLNVIMAGASVLQHPNVGHDNHVDIAVRIQKNVRRAARIIDDLLDLTQIQLAGGILLRRRTTDIGALVKELVNDFQLGNPSRAFDFQDLAEGVSLEGDPDRIAQVVNNLIGNAVRYGDAESPIRAVLQSKDGSATLQVKNAGPRIPQELLPTLFDPFRRGNAVGQTPRSTRSLGLGLFIAAAIVRAHGGVITARSDDSETAFSVELPIHNQSLVKDSVVPFSKA